MHVYLHLIYIKKMYIVCPWPFPIIYFLVQGNWKLRARLPEIQSELRPVWNLKPLWNIVLFTWQFHCEQPWNLKPLLKIVPFTWRFHGSNFPNHSKTLLHICKWDLLINAANVINAKQMLRYWLFFKQEEQSTCALVINFNDSAEHYFTASIYCFHGKLSAVWNFTSVKLTEVSFTTPEVMWTLIMNLPHTEVKFCPELNSQTGLSSLRFSCKHALNVSNFCKRWFAIASPEP